MIDLVSERFIKVDPQNDQKLYIINNYFANVFPNKTIHSIIKSDVFSNYAVFLTKVIDPLTDTSYNSLFFYNILDDTTIPFDTSFNNENNIENIYVSGKSSLTVKTYSNTYYTYNEESGNFNIHTFPEDIHVFTSTNMDISVLFGLSDTGVIYSWDKKFHKLL